MFTAIYMPSTYEYKNPTESGFLTEKAVEEYVESHLCKSCREDLKEGYIMWEVHSPNGTYEEREDINSV